MPQHCRICDCKQRSEIERMLVAGPSRYEVGRSFGLTEPSVRRHAQMHLPTHLLEARHRASVVDAEELVSELHEMRADLRSMLAQAKAAGDLGACLLTAREMRPTLELLAKLAGLLQSGTMVTVVNDLLPELGVPSREEALRLVKLAREVEDLTPAEGAANAILMLKAYLTERPEETRRVAEELRLTARPVRG